MLKLISMIEKFRLKYFIRTPNGFIQIKYLVIIMNIFIIELLSYLHTDYTI